MTNKFKNMTNAELAEFLMDYSKIHGGEITDLTREASFRIGILDVIMPLMEDDRK